MKRFLAPLVALALVAACQDHAAPTAATPTRSAASISAPAGVTIDQALSTAVAAALPTDQLVVLVSYNDSVTTSAAVTNAVLETGAGVLTYKNLPIVAALATPAQIQALATAPGVESVYLNKQLRYLLAESVPSIRAGG